MENNMENKGNMNMSKDGHVCVDGKCSMCGSGCAHCSMMSMKHHMCKRFLVLLFAVVLAFFVGMKVGMVKGFFYSNYGGEMHRSGWMMNSEYSSPVGGMMLKDGATVPATGTVNNK